MTSTARTLLTSSSDSSIKRSAEGEPLLGAQATPEVVATFCQTYSPAHVEPSLEELDYLWARCSELDEAAVVDVLCRQLSWSVGAAWEPRLRALCILGYLHRSCGEARLISKGVACIAGGLIQRLTQVPECQERASRLVAIFFGASAIGAARRQGMTRSSSLGSVTSIASAASGDEAEVLHML
mmetsp:Transcript_63406/g.204367  ORF Transcript_63406/g.204367 Transcript_63406/m.204367 type:complete len:183 (+) Transcript_63406:76-624(+)